MTIKPLFSENLLASHLDEFQLSSVAGIRDIVLKIKGLIEELEEGKIESLKEEEIKPRFVNVFFGDILGFNYGNSNNWQLRDEKKSIIDGTKVDTALGFFSSEKNDDDVRVVIEIKDANTDLDTTQARPGKQTPVEQAFGYVSKMGGKCNWVIVSNIKEIRFYTSLNSAHYQLFFLKDLQNESKLKELLFLFHKDRFINRQGHSKTDKLLAQAKDYRLKAHSPSHIIDKIYTSLKRFEGLVFVNPEYIANIPPFNILDDYVWHYDKRSLFTINSDIYDLLLEVTVENRLLVFSNKLQAEINSLSVVEARQKLEWSFKFLNHCLINEIIAIKDYKLNDKKNNKTIGFSYRHRFQYKEPEEGINKNIWVVRNLKCDCIICNYRNLDFNKLLSKLKVADGNLNFYNFEYAYGNYLTATNNFKTSYSIYKVLEKELKGKEGKDIEYFLAKQNILLLHNLALDYSFADSNEIMADIKSIDLDKVIYDEIEFNVDSVVRKYLIDLKDHSLIYKIQDEIEETIIKIEKLKHLYNVGGKQTSGPYLPGELSELYLILYLHVNSNYIVYDVFKRYQVLTEKVFKGLVISYFIPDFGIKTFNSFFLTEAILHIPSDSLTEILENIDVIKVEDGCIEDLLDKLYNFTSSSYKDGFFLDPIENSLLSEKLSNYRFEYMFTNIFANLFTVFAKLDISKDPFQRNIKSLIKFLKVEHTLKWFNLKKLSSFILQKGDLFEANDLIEILKFAVNNDRYGFNKYSDLIQEIPQSLGRFHPNNKIDNAKLLHTAILHSSSDNEKNANYTPLIYWGSVCDSNCKSILYNTFEAYLDKNFNYDFYQELVWNSDFNYDSKNYFLLYVTAINSSRSNRTYKYGKQELTDLIFINFIHLVYKLKIDFNRNELKVFQKTNKFESWLLNPFKFNYLDFDPLWLTDIKQSVILDRLKELPVIGQMIDQQLKNDFNPKLAEIKYKYFN